MKHFKVLRVFVVLLIASVFFQNIKAQVNNSIEIESKIDSIFSDFNDLTKPGAAVADIKYGEMVFKKAMGVQLFNMIYHLPLQQYQAKFIFVKPKIIQINEKSVHFNLSIPITN